jgi:hypothetical protein
MNSSHTTSNHIQKLLRVLQRENDLDWPSDETDWQAFANLCEDHQVAPFVFCRLNATGAAVPPGLFEYLRRRFFTISARNYHLAKQMVEVTSFLSEHRIRAVAFKGAAIAMGVYGDLALRQYQDIDLVVRAADLSNTVDLLVRRGFEIPSGPGLPKYPKTRLLAHEVILRAPDRSYFLDLHWRLDSARPGVFCLDAKQMEDRLELIQLPGGCVSSFCREDQFVALCCHGTKHGWARLKWLVDISEMLRQPAGFDWSRIETITNRKPLAKASVGLAILLAQHLLRAPMSATLPKVLAPNQRTQSVALSICGEILLQGHTQGFESFHFTLPSLEGGLVSWMSHLFFRYSKWFFEHAIVRVNSKDRALVPLPERLEFLYHVVRPIRLIGEYSGRLARVAFIKNH